MNVLKQLPNSTLSHQELKQQGYIIDSTCYPNIYYKGHRFDPAEWGHVLTNLEFDLLKALEGMLEWARRVQERNSGPEIVNALNAIDKAKSKS